jgi:2-polyprenyl-3-methyl-5-hydroxy-6-metoxy-1,4-benzoquinol methylase
MPAIETETTACLVCGSRSARPSYQLEDWACELPGDFTLVTCDNCGHTYQNPRPTQAAIGQYYPDTYQPFWHAIDDEPSAWKRRLRHWQWRARCSQVSRLRPGGRLLDVGAGTGIFLNEMRRYGDWRLAGVELSAPAADYARSKFGLEIFNGQVEDAPWPAGSFDVVTLWDVLEHLPNPQAALRKIHALLAPQGTLLFSVPNGGSIDARLFGRYWIGLDAPRHMSVFRLETLRRLLDETGFAIEAAFCFYGRYTTFALSLQQRLRAGWPASAGRRRVERLLFLPVWRYLSLPYFYLVDQLRLGAILAVRARPAAGTTERE